MAYIFQRSEVCAGSTNLFRPSIREGASKGKEGGMVINGPILLVSIRIWAAKTATAELERRIYFAS